MARLGLAAVFLVSGALDCGCFGGGGAVAKGDTRYPQELARDFGTLLLALWLLVRPRTPLSLDGWLRADPDAQWGRAAHPAG